MLPGHRLPQTCVVVRAPQGERPYPRQSSLKLRIPNLSLPLPRTTVIHQRPCNARYWHFCDTLAMPRVRSMRKPLQITFLLLIAWVVLMRSGCMTMRTGDKKWPKELANKGQRSVPIFIDVQGPDRPMHAVAIATADTLPLVMGVHGSPGSANAYMDHLADTVLTQRVRFIAVDRPGFGYSGFGDPEISLQAQAADLKAVLDQYAPNEGVYFLGDSIGGPLIVRFAMDFPESVRGLVLVAGSVEPDLEPHPWWQKPADRLPLRWLLPRSMWTSNHEILHLEDELRAMLLLVENRLPGALRACGERSFGSIPERRFRRAHAHGVCQPPDGHTGYWRSLHPLEPSRSGHHRAVGPYRTSLIGYLFLGYAVGCVARRSNTLGCSALLRAARTCGI